MGFGVLDLLEDILAGSFAAHVGQVRTGGAAFPIDGVAFLAPVAPEQFCALGFASSEHNERNEKKEHAIGDRSVIHFRHAPQNGEDPW